MSAPRKSAATRKLATARGKARGDELRKRLAKALNLTEIPQHQPSFPLWPRKTDFRKLADELNLQIKRPIDRSEPDTDGGATELLVPGYYTRPETDDIIARWAARKALATEPTLGELVGVTDPDQQIESLMAAIYFDSEELNQFIDTAKAAGKYQLLDTNVLSTLLSVPSNYIALRLDDNLST